YEGDLNNDFIEDPIVGEITGSVLDDIGNPIAGVTITLYNDLDMDGIADGNALYFVLSEPDGSFVFSGVEPGFYVIVETQPWPYGRVSDYDHSSGASDIDGDDSADGPDNDIPVRIMPGETDSDNIFINSRAGTICGYVITDTNQPMGGVQLILYEDVNDND